ncbi:MAG: Hsp20/alpha crystallin family protein [Nitrospirota bacterium]
MKSIVRWDPFRTMGAWDPFEEMRSVQREMDRLFNRVLGGERAAEIEGAAAWMPSIESYVKDDKLVIKAELPGIDAKDLDLSITDRELVIKGERKAEKDEKEKDYTYREISYGSFERRFLLPEGVRTEDLKATFTNGILEVSLPVPEVPKARKIEIKTDETRKLESGPTVKKAA